MCWLFNTRIVRLFFIEQEIQQLEILCKQLYEATDVVLRSNAEKTLVQFVSSQDALPKCQMLLDRADSSYAQLLAATTLTKLIQGLTLEQRIDIRYVMCHLNVPQKVGRKVLSNLIISLNDYSNSKWFYYIILLSFTDCYRSYVLNYLVTRPSLQYFVVQALITLLAKITKYGWFDAYKNELVFQNLLEDVRTFLQARQFSLTILLYQHILNCCIY